MYITVHQKGIGKSFPETQINYKQKARRQLKKAFQNWKPKEKLGRNQENLENCLLENRRPANAEKEQDNADKCLLKVITIS